MQSNNIDIGQPFVPPIQLTLRREDFDLKNDDEDDLMHPVSVKSFAGLISSYFRSFNFKFSQYDNGH